MADYIIKVDPADLRSSSKKFSGTNSDIKATTDEMINIISNISSWTGSASTAYVNKFNDLKKDMDTMQKMIQEHVDDLEKMAGVYEKAEEANAKAASILDTNVIS